MTILSDKLKKVKTPQDLRVLKVRLQYEAMRAEDDLNKSLHATEELFTIVSVVRKAGNNIRHAFSVISSISSFFSRIFKKKQQKEDLSREEEYHSM